MNIWRHYSW